MKLFIKKMLNLKNKDSENLFDSIKDISNLSNEIAKKQKKLVDKEYAFFSKDKDNYFISIRDFLELMEISDLAMKDIIARCKHSSEISTANSSSVVLSSIVEDNHIILCKDIKNCEKHKDLTVNKIRITTVRSVD